MSTLLQISADHESLRHIGPWLRDLFEGSELPSRFTSIELAVHELANNSVDHAKSDDRLVRLSAAIDQKDLAATLTVTVTDRGIAVDPETIPTPEEHVPQIRGYGLMIIDQVADELTYERIGNENVWTAAFIGLTG